ncbi:hypothetical protein SK128_022316, partial [Halocaridina rubra]
MAKTPQLEARTTSFHPPSRGTRAQNLVNEYDRMTTEYLQHPLPPSLTSLFADRKA